MVRASPNRSVVGRVPPRGVRVPIVSVKEGSAPARAGPAHARLIPPIPAQYMHGFFVAA